MPQVLLYYAIFFGFGVLYFDCPDPKGRVGGWWWLTLPLGLLVFFPVGYELTIGEFGLRDQWIPAKFHRLLAVVFQVVYTWLMTFGSMGFFRRFLSGESRTMRYLSDSSYWLYLAHLPLVIVAQMLLRSVDLPALAKFAIICTVVSGVLLLSYQWCVRYTPIGTLLNGPRKRPLPPIEAELVSVV